MRSAVHEEGRSRWAASVGGVRQSTSGGARWVPWAGLGATGGRGSALLGLVGFYKHSRFGGVVNGVLSKGHDRARRGGRTHAPRAPDVWGSPAVSAVCSVIMCLPLFVCT